MLEDLYDYHVWYQAKLYEWNSWEARTHQNAVDSKNALTPTDRARIEKENGAHYSELLPLPYVDVILYPLYHNLFLGIAKHTTNT